MLVMHRMGQVTCNCKFDQKGRGCQCDRPMHELRSPCHICARTIPRPSRAGIIRRVFEIFEIIKNAVDKGTRLDSGFISRRPSSTSEISRMSSKYEQRDLHFNVYRNKLASHANPGFCCQFINTQRFQICFDEKWILYFLFFLNGHVFERFRDGMHSARVVNVQHYRENKYFLTCETYEDRTMSLTIWPIIFALLLRHMDTHMLTVSQGYRTSSMTDRRLYYDVYKIAALTFVRTETFSGT